MSTIVKVPLAQATNQQLKDYALNVLNLEVKHGHSSAHIRSMIEAAHPGLTDIDVDESSPEAAPDAGAGAALDVNDRTSAHYRHDPKVKIQLMEEPGGSSLGTKDVKLSVQGDTLTLQRGVPVDIPYRFYLALENAKKTVMRETGELHPVTHMPVREPVEAHSVPFSILGPLPDQAAIDAWMARTSRHSL